MKQHHILRTEQDKQEFSLSFSKTKINPQKPIVVNLDYFYKKNSNQQLRAYWRLIKVCKLHINSKGNNFNDEEVSTYFKIKSGHYIDVDNIKLPRSIALNSKSFQIDNIEPKELLEYKISNIDKNNSKVIIKRIKCECEIKFIDN